MCISKNENVLKYSSSVITFWLKNFALKALRSEDVAGGRSQPYSCCMPIAQVSEVQNVSK